MLHPCIALHKMIDGVTEGGFILAFSAGEATIGSLNISYLLFADDTLVFYEVNQDHIRALRALFLCFKVFFGLKVNLSKSEVVLVGQVHNLIVWPLSWDVRITYEISWPPVGCSLQIDTHLE